MDNYSMNIISNFRDSGFNEEDLVNVMKEIDTLFKPPLSQRIINKSSVDSLNAYLKKVLELGNVYISHNSTEIQGFVMFYNNDILNKAAYISLVAVRPKFSGKGIASMLVKRVIEIVKAQNFIKIKINTWKENLPAISLYEKLGFRILRVEEFNVILKLTLQNKI